MRQVTNYGMIGGEFCLSPCDDPQQYYYPHTQECGDTCFDISINHGDYYLECRIQEVDTSSALDMILEASNSSLATLVSLNKLVQYTKYVDVEFPPRLQKLTYGKGRNIIALKYSKAISEDIQALFPKNLLPAPFERYNQPSDFVVNFWGNLASWIIVIIIAVVFTALEKLCIAKHWAKGRDIFERLKIICKWNLLLVLIGASLDDIVFFSSLEFRTLHLNSSIAGLSFEVCLVMVALLIVFVMGIIHLARQFRNLRSIDTPQKYEDFLLQWQGYQVLYRGFNMNHFLNRHFYLVYIVRLILPGLVAAWLFVSPVFQTVLYMFFNALIIFYVAVSKPILNKINHIQLLLLEATTFVINTCMFILVIASRYQVRPESSFTIMLGDIIICANSTLNVMILVFLLIKVFQAFKSIFLFQKGKTRKDRSQYVQVLVAVVQQAGLGFEEIYTDPQAQSLQELRQMNESREKELLRKAKKRTLVSGQKMNEFEDSPRERKSDSLDNGFSPKLIRTFISTKGKLFHNPSL